MIDTIYKSFLNSKARKFTVLIDPDKHNAGSLAETCRYINKSATDYIFIGGSLVSDRLDESITIIKSITKIPVILFPGSLMQLSAKADAILLLSLISGRNPDYLIGNHVLAAPFIKRNKLEPIPTGYILVGDRNSPAVEYISNTKPIPRSKPEIIIATAIAGEMLGNKLIYLEAGSGADKAVDDSLISIVRKNIAIPLIVGGGMKTSDDVQKAFNAGADMVVVGTAIEQNPELVLSMAEASNADFRD